MSGEQSSTVKALELAIRTELNGKTFYERASVQSSQLLGQQLFSTLAVEEDMHRKKFEEIYEAFRTKNSWPVVDYHPANANAVKTVFAQARRSTVKSNTTENEAILIALEIEDRSIDLYLEFAKTALYPAEKSLYETLVGEERGHRLALLDYQEYLKDPAGWFVGKEHPSLDGG